MIFIRDFTVTFRIWIRNRKNNIEFQFELRKQYYFGLSLSLELLQLLII